MKNKAKITNKCDGLIMSNWLSDDGSYKCKAIRRSDGSIENGCGEPCSWIMGKAGCGIPPWESKNGIKINPCAPDEPDTKKPGAVLTGQGKV
jgi:hypothetical protein